MALLKCIDPSCGLTYKPENAPRTSDEEDGFGEYRCLCGQPLVEAATWEVNPNEGAEGSATSVTIGQMDDLSSECGLASAVHDANRDGHAAHGLGESMVYARFIDDMSGLT
ncbi:hypothetical protein M1432_01975 [Patescibacteria group bacterium]|nr:hypothetical protein [Patescibacteria group bacterium]